MGQPLKAIKQMTKREAEPGMTYTAEPFDSKMTMTYTAEPFKSTANKVTPSETKTINTVTGYTGLPLNYPSYTYPMTYNSMAKPKPKPNQPNPICQTKTRQTKPT